MAIRFIATITADEAVRRRIRDRIGQACRWATGLEILIDAPPLLLAARGDRRVADGAVSAILGTLIERDAGAPASVISDGAWAAIGASRGARLIERYWGDYVAFIQAAGGAIDIVRAPFGALPCYIAAHDGAVLAASSPRLLAEVGDVVPDIVWEALARQLLVGDLRRAETCLAGIAELQGGERLTVHDQGTAREVLWSPWDWATNERMIRESAEAAAKVRAAVRTCVGARVRAAGGRVLLRLSGGLDSSIVAAALAHARADFASLTLVTDDACGDERHYARQAAERVGCALVERWREAARVDLQRSVAADLPRPGASFLQETQRLVAETAVELGAVAVFDGGGGDNVFCSLQSASPVADCWLADGAVGRLWPTACSIARLAETGVPKVLWRGARRAWQRRRGYRWPLDRRFLSNAAAHAHDGVELHPWLASPRGALPGKAAHVALLAAAQSYVEGFDPDQQPVPVAPLLAQPLVETSLRVPSWLWFDRGLNRAVAREAFRADLPSAVIERRSKGSPDGFIGEIYEINRATLREMLLGGLLAANGLVDQAALGRMLDDPALPKGHDYLRVIQLADAESWARAWTS